jgi:hypothetical protein
MASDRNDDPSHYRANGYGSYERKLSPPRAIFLPDYLQPGQTLGTVGRVVDSWV